MNVIKIIRDMYHHFYDIRKMKRPPKSILVQCHFSIPPENVR